ncbi:hypothetical protein H0H81_006596 [Sphagnurus paluster]|uniref:Uncharacterized protein n=1 Tax=Sphagnurus paluster TaxID=117069 RepID=A0A9P7GJY6_9AGAR|nr:hypothetical protein H0H81_006596 [Sphagnurus paluster]
MDDSSITDTDAHSLGPSVASILGIKGSLRFRPHGSTQKAHVILRRVTVSDDSSDDGQNSTLVRFSLFAQKRIEVKPGKEILLTVASHDGNFIDQPVVFEGDMISSEDISDEEDVTQVADEEELFVPPTAMPPKMRKTWNKRADDPSPVISTIERRPLTSIGIQTEPPYVSISTQAHTSCRSVSSQTQVTSTSASVQVDPPRLIQSSCAVQTIYSEGYKNFEVQTDQVLMEDKVIATSILPNDFPGKTRERSLSPMELDSPPESPQLSSGDIPHETSPQSGKPPTIVGDMFPKPHPPRIQSPAWSTASSPTAEDMQISSPIIRNSSSDRNIVSPTDEIPPRPNNKKPQIDISSRTIPKVPTTVISVPLLINTDKATKPTVRSEKQRYHNPFVSGGFMTEFVGPVDKLSGQEKPSSTVMRIKVEMDEDKSPIPTPKMPPSKMAPSPPPRSKSSMTPCSSTLKACSQNAVASSSKVLLEKPIPTKPMHHLRLSSTRALEKSPVTSLGLVPQIQLGATPSSPPPDPKSLAYISSGPSSNPLNIRPSASGALRNTAKVVPIAPKTLTQPSTKKRILVGTGWPLVKATNGSVTNQPLDSTPAPTTPAPPLPPPPLPSAIPPPLPTLSNLSNIVSYSSPSPPPTAPPPLPPSPPAIQPKWKPLNSGSSFLSPPAPSEVISTTAPATCPPQIPVRPKRQASGKQQKLGHSKSPVCKFFDYVLEPFLQLQILIFQ